jgi:hypothetical protein
MFVNKIKSKKQKRVKNRASLIVNINLEFGLEYF